MRKSLLKGTQEDIQAAWEKGIIIPNYDKNQARHDVCGDLIYKDAYGMNDSEYGWVISSSVENINDTIQIQLSPTHWKNDIASKDPMILGNCGC